MLSHIFLTTCHLCEICSDMLNSYINSMFIPDIGMPLCLIITCFYYYDECISLCQQVAELYHLLGLSQNFFSCNSSYMYNFKWTCMWNNIFSIKMLNSDIILTFAVKTDYLNLISLFISWATHQQAIFSSHCIRYYGIVNCIIQDISWPQHLILPHRFYNYMIVLL